MSKKTSTLFMGFATGSATVDAVAKRFIGVGSVWVKYVNPTKKELEEFWGRPQDKEPEYLDEIEIDGQKYQRARIDLLIETDPEYNNGISTKQRVSYFVTNKEAVSAQGKLQIMDKYGRNNWATPEEIQAKVTELTNKNGEKYQANISPDYWVTRRGEVEICSFIKAYLKIPDVIKWENNQPVGMIDNPAEAESSLEHIENLFKGDFSEIRAAVAQWPNNKVKLGFGVRTDENNRQYQAFFTSYPMKNGTTDYSRYAKKILDAKNSGSNANTEFEACPLKEYVASPSEVKPSTEAPKAPVNWFKQQ